MPTTMPHAVQFYQDDVFLIESVSDFIKSGLEENATIIVVATESHRKDLQRSFEDSKPAMFENKVMFFDAPEMLTKCMRDEWPNKTLFVREVGRIIEQATLNGPIRIFGEMVAVLWAQGHVRAAIRLEELWNDLATQYTFSLLCAYPKSGFSDQKDNDYFLQVCQNHTHVHTSNL